MRLAAISLLFLLSLLLLLSSAPAATAVQYKIKPGGAYTVKVTVHKPSYIKLLDGAWQIRAYFHSGATCYTVGSETDFGYSGWWNYTTGGTDWSGEPENRTFQVTVYLIDDMPTSGSANLRTRLVIKDVNATFPVQEEEVESGHVIFTIAGMSYRYQYQKVFDDYEISGEDFEGKIVYKAYKSNYDLYIDQDLPVTISEDAYSTDIFTMPSAINVNLVSTTQLEPSIDLPLELKAAIGVGVVVVVAAVVVYMTFLRRGAEEELPI